MDRDIAKKRPDTDQWPELIRFAGDDVLGRLRPIPALLGAPIQLSWAPALRAVGRLLRTGGAQGTEVHAASFIRERRIIFDDALRLAPEEMSRILIHEIYHFAWVRLSNAERDAWGEVLTYEFTQRARGELGWSAEIRKAAIRSTATVTVGRVWSEYSCESFCDTAAWIYAVSRTHDEFNLALRFRERRQAWFRSMERHHGDGIRI